MFSNVRGMRFFSFFGSIYGRGSSKMSGVMKGTELLAMLADQTGTTLRQALSDGFPENIPDPEWGKSSFLRSLPANGKLLDVGCGNNSPRYTKHFLPDWYYIGLDVGDYNQENPELADEYIVVPPDLFNCEIHKQRGKIDALISSHNLEHCDDRRNAIRFMAQALAPGGRLYLSFPSTDSKEFPKRSGCLNYFDDWTHQGDPPNFGDVISILHSEGLLIRYATTRFQPPIGWVLGLQQEQDSAADASVKTGTWWFWGFETVIWGERPV
jgi:SAM-dependent methyltransferase